VTYIPAPTARWRGCQTVPKTLSITCGNPAAVGLRVAIGTLLRHGTGRAAGASRLTQKPLGLIEGHASRNFTPALWMSADAYYHAGGETSIDGVNQRNAANTLRLGAVLWRGGT
jgi:hypothetical protein